MADETTVEPGSSSTGQQAQQNQAQAQAPSGVEAVEADFDELLAKHADVPDAVPEGRDAPEAPAAEAPAAQADGQPAEGSALDKGRKFAQSVREKARRNRELLARQQQFEQENAQLRQYKEQTERERELEARDPVAYWRAKGKTADEIAQIMMNAARVETPEDVARQALQETKSLKESLKEEIRRELQQELASQTVQRERAENWNKFVNETLADDARFPHLSEQPEPVVRWVGQEVVKAIIAEGEDPSLYEDDELADAMEAWYRKNARRKSAPKEGAAAVQKDQAPPARRPAPRTVTNDLGAKKFKLPPNYDQLSLEEQEAAVEAAWREAGS